MATTNKLIKGLAQIPIELALVPVIGKRAILKNWTNIKLSRDELIKFIQVKKPDGYTIVLGPANNGIVAVDIDGFGCHSEYEKIFGYLPNDDKTTVKVTSGKPGRRCEFYQIPATYWQGIESKEIHTGIFDSEGKEENLELRWIGKMQNLPPSNHPDTGKSYQYISSFEESIIAEAPLALIERMLKPLSTVKQEQSRPLTLVSSDYHAIHHPVSIEQIISKECRDLLGGVAEGGRNNIGAKLSRALIGAEESAKRLGINLSDTAEQLFYDFCSRCTPAIPEKEADNIWKNALKDNPTSTLSDDYILNCVAKVKYSPNNVNYSLNATPLYPHNKIAHQFTEVIDGQRVAITRNLENIRIHPNIAEQVLNELYEILKNLVDEVLNKSERQTKFEILSKQFGVQISTIEKIYRELENEHFDTDDQVKKIKDYQNATNKRLKDINRFLPGPLQNISNHCENLGFDPEVGLLLVYTSVAAMLTGKTCIELLPTKYFYEFPTLYSVLIAPSGSKKTAIQSICINEPFSILDEQAEIAYLDAQKRWNNLSEEQQKSEPEPYQRLHCLDNGATPEGVRDLVAKNPSKGILIAYDEISGMWASQNKYSKKGDEQQQMLKLYGGNLGISARAGSGNNSRGTKKKVNISIVGSIQPLVLKDIFQMRGGRDSDGGFSRFMMVFQEPRPALYKAGETRPANIAQLLAWLYSTIDSLPPLKFTLAPTAFEKFAKFYNDVENQKLDTSIPEPIALQYNKLEGKVGKMIMLVHIVNTIIKAVDWNAIALLEKNGIAPAEIENRQRESVKHLLSNFPTEIDRNTVVLGIQWGNYQIAQIKSVYSLLCNEDNHALYAKILAKAENGVSPSQLKSYIWELRKLPLSEVHNHLQNLCNLGLGYIQPQKRGYLFFRQD